MLVYLLLIGSLGGICYLVSLLYKICFFSFRKRQIKTKAEFRAQVKKYEDEKPPEKPKNKPAKNPAPAGNADKIKTGSRRRQEPIEINTPETAKEVTTDED